MLLRRFFILNRSLCVSVRVSDIEEEPILRVSLPIGISLMHARQFITDEVHKCSADDDDEETDAMEGAWRLLQALAVSNDYTFSKQGASVVRSAEWKIPALKLAVIEGSRVFHRHSQSEELALVFLPSFA